MNELICQIEIKRVFDWDATELSEAEWRRVYLS